MLVLNRKLGERIVVPQCGLAITIVALQGHAVRPSVDAPQELAIFREEVWRQIDEKGQKATIIKGP